MRTIRALTVILFMTITMQARQSAAPQAPGAGRGAAPATTSAPETTSAAADFANGQALTAGAGNANSH